ncbi:hypothetical protein COO60DRAFT_1638150 [Scenedesmus sp. NREL 46B-D3]|nr:hypothetical protein COO60DRAFT_1638150 [Scenedesmus sp. NREL 46B-D3]
MCASSVALGASVDRTGKLISGRSYSTIISSIPTNPMLAARSGLSNCREVESQVLLRSGALDAATDQALADCQKLDPLFLLNVYRGCDFSVPADPALADNTPLTAALNSGLVPSGAVRAGQDAAAGWNRAVDGARAAVQTIGDGARAPRRRWSMGGACRGGCAGAFSEVGRVFNIGG